MPGDELSDLVRRAQAGDRDATDALVRHVEPRLRAIVHGRLPPDLRRRVDSDDIYQSTMSVALREIPNVEFRGDAKFYGWLASVAERRVVDAARRHRAGNRDVAAECGTTAAGACAAAETAPPDRVVREETETLVRRAMGHLSEAERTVLDLRTEQGLQFPEIAKRMGLTDKYAARRLYVRAMEELAQHVGEA
jgi:RNA polymerase sigma factor (sigma-70 family)